MYGIYVYEYGNKYPAGMTHRDIVYLFMKSNYDCHYLCNVSGVPLTL